MDHYLQHIPAALAGQSGAVFNSGRLAYSGASDLYLLGLNPGGDPETHVLETVDFHTHKVLARPDNWCEHRDEAWDGRTPGTAGMQPRVLHLLRSLGLDPGLVPSSNVVFARTRGQAQLAPDFGRLALMCWPLHAAVIEGLRVRTVLCFGKTAGSFIRQMTGANQLIGTLKEANKRRWSSDAYANAAGLQVIVATHPSRVAWNSEASDPTPLVRRVMGFQAPVAPKPLSVERVPDPEPWTPRLKTGDRTAQLADLYRDSGLDRVFVSNGQRYFAEKRFSKLSFGRNDHRISSIELWDRLQADSFFRIHFLPGVSTRLVDTMRQWPQFRNDDATGVNFVGESEDVVRRLVAFLSPAKAG